MFFFGCRPGAMYPHQVLIWVMNRFRSPPPLAWLRLKRRSCGKRRFLQTRELVNDTKPDLPWKKPSLETFLGSIKNCFLWIVGFLRPVLGRYGMMSWGTKWVSLVMMKSWLLLYGRGCDWCSFLHLFPLLTLHNDEGLGEWCHFSLKKSKLPQPQKTTRQFIPQYDPIWWTISPWERTLNFEILF